MEAKIEALNQMMDEIKSAQNPWWRNGEAQQHPFYVAREKALILGKGKGKGFDGWGKGHAGDKGGKGWGKRYDDKGWGKGGEGKGWSKKEHMEAKVELLDKRLNEIKGVKNDFGALEQNMIDDDDDDEQASDVVREAARPTHSEGIGQHHARRAAAVSSTGVRAGTHGKVRAGTHGKAAANMPALQKLVSAVNAGDLRKLLRSFGASTRGDINELHKRVISLVTTPQ
jgi:hypothetical protein